MNMPPSHFADGQTTLQSTSASRGPTNRWTEADPGTASRSRLAWLVIGVFGLAVVGFQQFGALKAPPAPTPVQASVVSAPDEADPAALTAKMLAKIAEVFPADPASQSALVANAQNPASRAGNIEAFRDTILRSHLLGKDGWTAEYQAFSAPATPWNFDEADKDTATIVKLMDARASGRVADVDDAARERLAKRHGIYGQLAGVLDKTAGDPTRDALVGGGAALIAVFIALGVGLLAVVALAMTCGIIAAVKLLSREVRWRMDLPAVGGSVLIETVAVFIVGFCSLKLIAMLLEATLPTAQQAMIGPITMGMQWALLAAPLWGLFRGVPWPKLRMLLGLHAGEGVMKEIGCGLFAYFAGLPLVFVAIVVSLIAVLIQGAVQAAGGQAAPPTNPIVEIVTKGGTFELVMLFALAAIWAPIVEELIFRGALFRHLRGWMPLLGSAAISAVMFAVMHGYPFFLLGPVMVLGFNFALMREWRGSLIAPMVMHSLHNATTLAVVLVLLRTMG